MERRSKMAMNLSPELVAEFREDLARSPKHEETLKNIWTARALADGGLPFGGSDERAVRAELDRIAAERDDLGQLVWNGLTGDAA
jgi:hypothetical protein